MAKARPSFPNLPDPRPIGACLHSGFINNMWSGSKHDSTQVPLFTVGGLGGTLKTGRVLDYGPRGDENRKLCSLYLSLMNRMGLPADRFGDADSPLADL